MGKNILVLAATAKEISPFIQSMKKDDALLKNNNIDILVSGIGLTSTSYHLTKQLALKNYNLVIQAGVAGSYDTTVQLGKVVVVKQDSIADQSLVEMKKLKLIALFFLGLLASCNAIKTAVYDQYSYQQTTSLKVDVSKIVDKLRLQVTSQSNANIKNVELGRYAAKPV